MGLLRVFTLVFVATILVYGSVQADRCSGNDTNLLKKSNSFLDNKVFLNQFQTTMNLFVSQHCFMRLNVQVIIKTG